MKWKRVQAAVKNKSNTVIWQTAVKRSPFLSRLPKEELKYIKTNARLQALSAGEVIFEEGSEPEYYYIVQDGMVRATQFQGDVIKRARDYGPSDGFGSHEMLYPGMRRTTTCTAVDEVMVWTLSRRVFDMKLKNPIGSIDKELLRFVKSIQFLKDALERDHQSTLTNERYVQLARTAKVEAAEEGTVLTTQGEHDAHKLFVVKSGTVETFRDDADLTFMMTQGDMFGEAALLYEPEARVRQAHAKSKGATLVTWSTQSIESVIGFPLQKEAYRVLHRKMLAKVEIAGRKLTEGLSDADFEFLLANVTEALYYNKQVVAPRPLIAAPRCAHRTRPRVLLPCAPPVCRAERPLTTPHHACAGDRERGCGGRSPLHHQGRASPHARQEAKAAQEGRHAGAADSGGRGAGWAERGRSAASR